MNTKTLSLRGLSVINQYLHFQVGTAVCSVPYFNNKTRGARVSLRAYAGKGSPKEIFDEVETLILRHHIDPNSLSDEALKKIMTDNNIGIDCSGLAYYILNTESEERKTGSLDRKLSFINCRGILGKIRCSINPVGNCDVATLADNTNSSVKSIKDIQPADIITMMSSENGGERNHILIVHQVEYQNSIPTKMHYTHTVAYPEDGVYGTGIKQGAIEILDPAKSILDQRWIENSSADSTNRILERARKSVTEIRTLNWF
jgi:hypothetical protein